MDIKKKLINHLKKVSKRKINQNTNLIEKEFIDSFGIIELVSYIENSLKLNCPISKVSTSNFKNISSIVQFLKKNNKSI
jgi:acyl carrier protein|tara:strand:- start:193 stop:429 length:237 start_codon:yes stop_codon:yes gene_type:complete